MRSPERRTDERAPSSASAASLHRRPAAGAAAAGAAAAAAGGKASRGPGVRQMTREQREAWYASWELPGHHFQPPAQHAQHSQQQQAQRAQQARQECEQPGTTEQEGAAHAAWLQLAQWDGTEEGEQLALPGQQEEGQQTLGQRGSRRMYQPVSADGKRGDHPAAEPLDCCSVETNIG